MPLRGTRPIGTWGHEPFISPEDVRRRVKAIVRVNAAPGFEDSAEAAVRKTEGVLNVIEDKAGNYDLAILLEADDANRIRDIENAIRHETGIQGLERVDDPDRDLLKRLRPA